MIGSTSSGAAGRRLTLDLSHEQRVRIALALIQARESARPVRMGRLARELPDLEHGEILAALETLCARLVAHRVADGFLLRPPPGSDDATRAMAQASRLHARR